LGPMSIDERNALEMSLARAPRIHLRTLDEVVAHFGARDEHQLRRYCSQLIWHRRKRPWHRQSRSDKLPTPCAPNWSGCNVSVTRQAVRSPELSVLCREGTTIAFAFPIRP